MDISLRTSESHVRTTTCMRNHYPRIVDHMTSSLSDIKLHRLFWHLDLDTLGLVLHLSRLHVSFLTDRAIQSSFLIFPDENFASKSNCIALVFAVLHKSPKS